MSTSSVISEDVKAGTVLTMMNVQDPDSNENGKVRCILDDRVPALSSSVTLTLQISDVNDNAPVFERSLYEAYITENNKPGLSIFSVKAKDADWNQNARVSYILEDSSVNGVPVSSYVSVSADSGVIHAVRSFDYEQIKDFKFVVKAQDGGSPPLSGNVTVKILIQDQNDNPPQVLYPVQTGGSVVAEMVPRSADVGYLVTKVVAVDVDSGQNAWLSFKLQKTTDRALFEVGLQNGEIRTIRQVTDKDAVKQRLTVIVEDNGQPSRSATVIVNVAVADSFPEVLWRQSRILYHSNLPVIPYYPPRYSDTLGTGTLPHVYNYEVCRTTDSRKSDFKFGRAGSQNVLIMDPSSTGTMQRIQSEKSILDEPDSPVEITARDLDSGNNGKVVLNIPKSSPFTLKPSFSNNYELLTSGPLDREKFSEYNIEITATDSGSPRLCSSKIIPVRITDVNDNPPMFTQSFYNVYLKENGVPGSILYSVSATDVDSGENAKISYSILDSKVQDVSVSSYVYINSDNGSIYSMHSFDYEKLKVFQILVQAKDQGSPSLSSNATVHVFILDQNDNAPAVIYPSSAAFGSLSHQKMPTSAKAGHLVTKVTAVDADSGHNAWISYRLVEATDASLFTVNLYTGEVRTKRAVSEQDESSQRLIIEIKDDGEPVQSATVTVSIQLEDGLHEPILDLRHKVSEPSKKTGRITLYLILSLASVSVLSLVTFLILAVKCIRNSRSSGSCCMRRSDCDDYKNPNRNLQLQLNTDGPIKYVEVLGGDMMSQSQSFRSCMSPMSEYSDFTLIKPSSTTDFKEVISVLDASLPDSTWTFESQQVSKESREVFIFFIPPT
ncbi:protocadherin beta-7-like [Xenentodon cancila]